MKPFKGSIKNWYKSIRENGDYIIRGTFVDHESFAGKTGHTSMVVSFNEDTGEVETLNSRYKVIGERFPDQPYVDEFLVFLEQVEELKKQGYKVDVL